VQDARVKKDVRNVDETGDVETGRRCAGYACFQEALSRSQGLKQPLVKALAKEPICKGNHHTLSKPPN
jgi:hypothetical protein